MKDANNIWNEMLNGKDKGLTEEKLKAYLEGKLSPAEQHEVEALFAHEDLFADAIEGLQQQAASESEQSKTRINTKLRQSLKYKKSRRGIKKELVPAWMYILIILLLAIMAYLFLAWL